MKVLRIVSELDFGGVEQVALNSFLALHKQTDLRVLLLKNGGRASRQLFDQGIAIEILDQNPRIPNFSLIALIRKVIRDFQPDVVHCQGAEANFHGVIAASKEKSKRIIAEEIGIPNHHSYWKWIFKWVYRKAHVVIAISNAVKNSIVELGEVKGEKVRIIYNPISSIDSLQDRWTVDRGKNVVFITTCRLVPIKNLDRLILAFSNLVEVNPGRKINLRILGDGPERENLEFRILNSELNANVEMLGFQSNVWPYLAEADAFVLPSLREGSSVSLAEAMSAGLPSIVTKVGGASEILGNSKSGILIDPLNTSEIQQAMQSILDLSEDERKELGLRAQEESKRFSVDNYFKELMKVYCNSYVG